MARAGNTSTAHVVITMEGKQALDFMNQLQQQAQHTRQELQQMEAAGQQGTDDYKDKVEELKRLERAVQKNRSAYIDLNQVVNNLQNTSLLKLQKALKEVRKQMYALDPEKLAREGRKLQSLILDSFQLCKQFLYGGINMVDIIVRYPFFVVAEV